MRHLVVVAALALAGCAMKYSGAARETSRAALDREPGWVMADVAELEQRELADCGPTALAILAARWGIDPELARETVASPDDASFAELRDAARALGLSAFVIEADAETLVYELSLGRPVILGLLRPIGRTEARGHYEVVAGVHPERELAATVDPGGGWKVRTFAELDLEWVPTKRAAMVVIGTTARTGALQRTVAGAP